MKVQYSVIKITFYFKLLQLKPINFWSIKIFIQEACLYIYICNFY